MRYIHPAAWAGLCLNIILGYILISSMSGLDLSAFDGRERELMATISQAMRVIRPLYYVLLTLQAVALGLIAMGLGFGLGLSIAAGVLMLPGAAIYMLGCALSHYRVKYAAFASAPTHHARARFTFPAHALLRTRIITGALLLATVLSLLGGVLDLSVTLIGLSLAGIYCSLRAASRRALSLYDDHFTVTPALFAERVLVPYSNVRQATLGDDQTITFAVETPSGLQELRWRLETVRPKERRAALEELGAALSARHVPLY